LEKYQTEQNQIIFSKKGTPHSVTIFTNNSLSKELAWL